MTKQGSIRLALALVAQQAPVPPPNAPVASVVPHAETVPVPSDGDAADDACIWIHPTDTALSLIIATDKQSGIALYDLSGKERQFLANGQPVNVDVRYDFRLDGAGVGLVTTGLREENRLVGYVVDPATRMLRDVTGGGIPLDFDVHGCCMYRSRASGEYYFFGTSKEGIVQQWRLFDDGKGGVGAERVRTFDVGSECEGCVADDEHAWFFVGEEDVGIWRYGAEPSTADARVLVDATGKKGQIEGDVEGLTIYYSAEGAGYLIASSQGSDSFAVYERRAPHTYLHEFKIGANSESGLDAVTGTDGIDLVNLGLGPPYPGGLFVAQDDKNPRGNQNFKLVDWRKIAASASPPLIVDVTYDAAGAR